MVAAFAAIGLTAATAVIAMAARASLSRSTPVNGASARAPVTALLLLCAGAGMVALAGLAALLWPGRRRSRTDEPQLVREPLQVHWIWKLLASSLPFVLGAVLVAAAVLGASTVTRPPRLESVGARGGALEHQVAAPSRGSGFVVPSWLPWTVVGIVVVAIAVGAVLLIRGRERPADEASERTTAQEAVQSAIGALDAVTDPRSAVIAAYAAMVRTLAAHGVARPPAEAPREYLRRVLVANRATEHEARTLTGLFEEARFSTHPIPEQVRELALSALSSLRSRLQAGGAR